MWSVTVAGSRIALMQILLNQLNRLDEIARQKDLAAPETRRKRPPASENRSDRAFADITQA